MNIDDIITLIKAGYTKEEITALLGTAQASTVTDTPQETAPKEEPAPQLPAADPVQEDPAAQILAQQITAMKKEIADLKKVNQTLAMLGDPGAVPVDTEARAVEALAKIINPPIRKE